MINNNIKIATIDIETYPAKVLMYGNTYEPVIVEILEFEFILSIVIKINDRKPTYYGLNTMKGYKKGSHNDKELLRVIQEKLKDVDYICGQNSDDFDIRKIKERLMYHRLPALPKIPTLDTKKLYKQVSKLPNNKLNTISKFTGNGQKTEHNGTDLFIACGNGDKKAWALNKKYNTQDVELTWKDLEVVLPYINLPARYSVQNGEVMNCPDPTCGGVMTKEKKRRVVEGWKQQWQCTKCHRYHTPNKLIEKIV